MTFRIRSIDTTSTGREIVRERDVPGAMLSVGRASENILPLPDLAVEQQHLTIAARPNGTLAVEAVSALGFAHDGQQTREAVIDPARGGEIALGSYRLEIGREDGVAVITVRQVADDGGEARDRLRGFSLETAMPSRRLVSWGALTAILVAFLAVPIWSHLTREETKPDIDADGQVLMDASWSTGDLSMVHHGLEDSCEACHTQAFVSVTDTTCLSCHEDIADHAEPPRMSDGRAPFGPGDQLLWDISAAFNKPGPGACTECHTEHEGPVEMQPVSEQYCADCHETMDQRLTDTALGNAADFGQLHPQFKALVVPGRGAEETRLSLDDITEDFSGLKFPHDMHLSATNGVARMAMRLDIASAGMECSNCHEEDSEGIGFLPIDMEESCESCHSLVYDRVGNTFRSLSHGDVDRMQADLLAADRSPRRPVASGRQRPGNFAEGGMYYSNFSSLMPGGLTRTALSEDGLCGECHYPATGQGGGLAVVPVTQRDRFFTNGWFDHGAHEQEECSSCHAAETSGAATDLLLPGLDTVGAITGCRDCHEGESAVKAEVPSSCALCHSYHPHAGAPTMPPDLPDRKTPVASRIARR